MQTFQRKGVRDATRSYREAAAGGLVSVAALHRRHQRVIPERQRRHHCSLPAASTGNICTFTAAPVLHDLPGVLNRGNKPINKAPRSNFPVLSNVKDYYKEPQLRVLSCDEDLSQA